MPRHGTDPPGEAPTGGAWGRLQALAAELRARPSGVAELLRVAHTERPRVEGRALGARWLLAVLAGEVTVTAALGARAHAQARQVLLLPARTRLELALAPGPGGAAELIELELVADVLLRWLPADLDVLAALEAATLRPRALGPGAVVSLAALCEALLAPDTHPWTLEHQAAGVLLALVVEGAEAPERLRAQARLDLTLAVRQLVRERPDGRFGVVAIAHRLGLSPATLRRRLAQAGTGLRRLVQGERMELGRALLGDGRLNVSEVALRCGYESPAKFARQFRQAFGVVPSQFRGARGH